MEPETYHISSLHFSNTTTNSIKSCIHLTVIFMPLEHPSLVQSPCTHIRGWRISNEPIKFSGLDASHCLRMAKIALSILIWI